VIINLDTCIGFDLVSEFAILRTYAGAFKLFTEILFTFYEDEQVRSVITKQSCEIFKPKTQIWDIFGGQSWYIL
jgi:hypothetical protein